MRLGVDVMGGDHAPDAILKGCIQAADDLQQGDVMVLVGDEATCRDWLNEAGLAKDPRFEIVHTTEVIGMDEHPVSAVRTKKNSSLNRMAEIGAPREANRCDAVVSAGNTGACVAASMQFMRRLPGVHRPGIAVPIPTFYGPVVLCDAGANPEPRPNHLWQYALMGETVARVVNKIESPRIGLINIGSEEAKGTDLIRETHAMLRATPQINYIGFVEGRDLFSGACDVVVTDGLVGNTLLKMAEGMASQLFKGICAEVMNADPDLMLKLEPIFKEMFRKNDYHEHGGAPLLGVNGMCLIAHGSSEAKSIRAALKQCRKYVQTHLNDGIVKRIAEVPEPKLAPVGAES